MFLFTLLSGTEIDASDVFLELPLTFWIRLLRRSPQLEVSRLDTFLTPCKNIPILIILIDFATLTIV